MVIRPCKNPVSVTPKFRHVFRIRGVWVLRMVRKRTRDVYGVAKGDTEVHGINSGFGGVGSVDCEGSGKLSSRNGRCVRLSGTMYGQLTSGSGGVEAVERKLKSVLWKAAQLVPSAIP